MPTTVHVVLGALVEVVLKGCHRENHHVGRFYFDPHPSSATREVSQERSAGA